jgi:hypothetical protein
MKLAPDIIANCRRQGLWCVLCDRPIVDTDALRVDYLRSDTGAKSSRMAHGPCLEQWFELLLNHRKHDATNPILEMRPLPPRGRA